MNDLEKANAIIEKRKKEGKYIGADKFREKLMKEPGMTKEEAGAIIGINARRILGKKGAAAKAAEGRKQ